MKIPSKPIRILLVEDNSADAVLIQLAIEAEGLPCAFKSAEDGQCAIDYIEGVDGDKEPRPDLVMLDMQLPKESGGEVLRSLAKSERCAFVPVIIMTTAGPHFRPPPVLPKGTTTYFWKPMDLDNFMRLGPLTRAILQDAYTKPSKWLQ